MMMKCILVLQSCYVNGLIYSLDQSITFDHIERLLVLYISRTDTSPPPPAEA